MRLSYSSLSTYAECGEKWRLSRGYKLDRETWYATVAGTAIHNITEWIDLAEMGLWDKPIPTFQQEFDTQLQLERDRGRLVKPSGRVLKTVGKGGGPNKKDYEWWLQFGPERVANWIDWKASSGFSLLELDGKPAIEVAVEFELDGDKQVGYIDRLYADSNGEVAVIDIKNGAVPASVLQLAVYKLGLLRTHGIEASWGGYWMSQDGELTGEVDLKLYSTAYVESLFLQAWKGIRAGVFLPNVTGMCKGCSVRDWCRAVGGSKAITVPMMEQVSVGSMQ